ncbi:calnexin independence factor cif1 [Gigaspora margarita]|uniref:Calnexin independence factor cif1 n=1 Tax=Gigaspora margarita TaxID=4874 RepID=A0A8H3X5D4_GIGMA|nr:calnexin independence factor cif1 [Gigaspora margarita]
MIAINYNAISNYHWDKNDEPNSLCCFVALGDFKEDELCFPQLKIIVLLRPGQVIVFFSCLLLYEYKDLKDGIDRDANGKKVSGKICRQNLEDASTLNQETRLLKPKPD